MISNAPLTWNLLLSIFTYCAVAQSVMVAVSNFDSTSTMTDVDTTQRKAQGLFTRICSPGRERFASVGYAISTRLSNDATTRQLNRKEIVQTSLNIEGAVTVANFQSSVMETLGPFAEVDNTIATNKMATVLTQIAIDGSQRGTTVLSGNDNGIKRTNKLPNDVYESSTDGSRLLRNDLWELDPQSNATRSEMVGTRGNTTMLQFLAEEDYWQERLSVTLVSYISPFLIVIGTLGNAASVITFQHRCFRSSSTGFILIALSVVDIAVLNTYLMGFWLMSAFGIKIQNITRLGCKVFFCSAYYLHQLASWTLILLTVERTIALWLPLRCKELCSKRRIVIIWIVIASVLLAVHTFIFLAFDLVPTKVGFDDNNITKVEYDCRAVNDYWSHLVYGKWAIFDAVMGDFFPFLVILIGNTLTITRILKSHWDCKTQMGAVSTSKPMASSTVMLIGISAMFLIFNLPFDDTYLYYLNIRRNSLQKEEKAIYDLAYAVGTLSYNSNNAFEFIVYFVGGRKFSRNVPTMSKDHQPNVMRKNEKRNTDTGVTSSEM